MGAAELSAMGIESMFVSQALPDGDFGQKAVIYAHRYMASRIHRLHSSVGAVHSAIQKFRPTEVQTFASSTREASAAKRLRSNALVVTLFRDCAYAEL